MQLTRLMVPENKYSIKCPYSMNANGICVHNTANKASAMAEISYMVGNNNKISYHYAVDDYRIVQGIEENRNAWHAGDGSNGKGNRNKIAIEICYSTGSSDLFNKSEILAAKFIAYKLKEKGWGIERVSKHQDYDGKYCPHKTLDLGWKRFLNMIRAELGQATVPVTPSTPVNNNTIIHQIQSTYNSRYGNILGQIEVDGSAGPDTKKHLIMALQYEMNKQYGCSLSRDGSFGPLSKAQFKDLKRGVSGNITWICQAFLYIKGYNPNGLDSSFGPGMEECVKQFQRNNGLKVDGILGMNTAYKLFN